MLERERAKGAEQEQDSESEDMDNDTEKPQNKEEEEGEVEDGDSTRHLASPAEKLDTIERYMRSHLDHYALSPLRHESDFLHARRSLWHSRRVQYWYRCVRRYVQSILWMQPAALLVCTSQFVSPLVSQRPAISHSSVPDKGCG